jgi:lipoyl(octanoyl) transferase
VSLAACWLGRVAYDDATAIQEAVRARVLTDGEPAEALLLLEHPPVVTLGRRADRRHLLASPARLASAGITVAESSRGGDVTYHGPGQLVAYPVVRLTRGVVAHVEALAAAANAVANDAGREARVCREPTGVFVGDDKLAAIGVHVHRRVATHGLALNVSVDLAAFGLIVPCGLADVRATSLAALTGAAPSVAEVAPRFAAAFAAALGRALDWRGAVEPATLRLGARP